MEKCRVCNRVDVEPEDETRACADCRRTLGIRPLPPPRRPAVPCMRCRTWKFIRVVPREVTAWAGHEVNYQQAAPMALSYPRKVELSFWKAGQVNPIVIEEGVGVLETYVCAACGFVEWYCQDAHRIPIGPEHMSDVVDFTPEAPYR